MEEAAEKKVTLEALVNFADEKMKSWRWVDTVKKKKKKKRSVRRSLRSRKLVSPACSLLSEGEGPADCGVLSSEPRGTTTDSTGRGQV